MVGPLFLYSTSPAPHESTILHWARSRRADPHRPLAAVVMQTPLPESAPSELDGLHRHFCSRGVAVHLEDSGLAGRRDAMRQSVVERLSAADLILITGGSPELLYERTVDTPALAALRAAWADGAAIAGCSAGAVALGAGMPSGTGDGRRPYPLWRWIGRTVVAPHFGRYAIDPWLHAFPDCSVLGIPDDAMALVLQGRDVHNVGDRPLSLLPGLGRPARQVDHGQRAVLWASG